MKITDLKKRLPTEKSLVLEATLPGSDDDSKVYFRFRIPSDYLEFERVRKKGAEWAEVVRRTQPKGGVKRDMAQTAAMMAALSLGVRADDEAEFSDPWTVQDFMELADSAPTLFSGVATAFVQATGGLVSKAELAEVETVKKDSNRTQSSGSTSESLAKSG